MKKFRANFVDKARGENPKKKSAGGRILDENSQTFAGKRRAFGGFKVLRKETSLQKSLVGFPTNRKSKGDCGGSNGGNAFGLPPVKKQSSMNDCSVSRRLHLCAVKNHGSRDVKD